MPKRAWQNRLLAPLKESDIQKPVEDYLKLLHKPYFRLPDSLFRLFNSTNSLIPLYIRKELSEHLSDWPDLLIPRDVPWSQYPLLLALELKRPKGVSLEGKKFAAGKPTDGQLLLGAFIRMRVVYSLDDAISEIDQFFKWSPAMAREPIAPASSM